MSIKLKLEGFEELLQDIEKAGRSMDSAVESTMKQSAQIMQSELKAQMQEAKVPSELINAMPQPEVFRDGNAVVAKVGYKKGSYNPDNLSYGYKVVFFNYGTPHRSKHGKMVDKGFIEKAKKKAKTKLKKQQAETLKKILSRLQK